MANENENNSQTNEPSLLELQSRGGDTAEKGGTFQADVVLSMIPEWLSIEGFTSMVREGMLDAEAKFFAPGRGYKKEGVEVKGKQLGPSEFWHEIERFQQIDIGTKGEYQWFTLVTTGLHQDLHPLVNTLRRIRDPYEFYEDSQIHKNSFDKYSERVRSLGKTNADAEFLFKKVLIFDDSNFAHNNGNALFKESLTKHLPHHQELANRILEGIYNEVSMFVRNRRNQTINRNELEAKLSAHFPDKFSQFVPAIRVHTAINDIETNMDKTALRFEWADFFAGESRNYPPPEIWNERMIGELLETKKWILERRSTKRIYLTGNRRLSASLAIGSIFSAVAGFSIEMQQRDEVFATDSHAEQETPEYEIQFRTNGENSGQRLVVSIGIIRDVVPEVEQYLKNTGLENLPQIHIRGEKPIISPEQTNLVTSKLKNIISEKLTRSGANQIDLFIAAPAFLALFLGHRLNATAPVQCYERAAPSEYVPTCLLFKR